MTDVFNKIFLTIKDVIGLGIFVAFLALPWFDIAMISPAMIIMLPVYGVAVVGLAIYQIRQYSNSSNFNIEGLLKLISGLTNGLLIGIVAGSVLLFTILAILATQSPIVFAFIGFVLVQSPILIMASISVAVATQLVLLGLSLLRWSESPEHSAQRSHFLQDSIAYLFDALTTAVILGAVVTLFFAPFTPFLLPCLATAAIILTIGQLKWRFASTSFKNDIKYILGIEQFEENDRVVAPTLSSENNVTQEITMNQQGSHLFTSLDHCSIVKKFTSIELQKEYLLRTIESKLTALNNGAGYTKTNSKRQVLEQLRDNLTSDEAQAPVNKKHLVVDHPEVFNSFFREKGEVESITDAYNWLCTQKEETPVMALS